jgi:hypothetical protein
MTFLNLGENLITLASLVLQKVVSLTNTLIDFKNSLFFDFAAKTVSSI